MAKGRDWGGVFIGKFTSAASRKDIIVATTRRKDARPGHPLREPRHLTG